MNDDGPHEPSDPLPTRPPLIHLDRDRNGQLIVLPAPATGSARPPFRPFALPRLPLSLHCWMTGLGAEFQRRYEGRCVAMLLVLDCRDGRWVRPVIPAQTCGREGSAWTMDLGDEPLGPDQHVGGSFQVRQARDVVDATATVPLFDGLHVVETLRGRETMAYLFHRASDETICVPADDAMVDDWAEAMAEAAPRMTLR